MRFEKKVDARFLDFCHCAALRDSDYLLGFLCFVRRDLCGSQTRHGALNEQQRIAGDCVAELFVLVNRLFEMRLGDYRVCLLRY